MGDHRISEAARKSGIPATTLRYYEDIGLVTAPGRTDAGYRVYDDRSIDRLRFITRAKELGISLEEIRQLVDLWDADQCGPVQQEMLRLVDAKIADTEVRAVELAAFAAQLRAVAARLRDHRHAGPCDESCACASPMPEPEIACTLASVGDMQQRIVDWRALVDRARTREDTPGGVRLTFTPDADTSAAVARLATLEVACCTWFDLTMKLTPSATVLEVRAPAAGQAFLAELFAPPPG
jgi:DNA-binding transcriptional MerR regulator